MEIILNTGIDVYIVCTMCEYNFIFSYNSSVSYNKLGWFLSIADF